MCLIDRRDTCDACFPKSSLTSARSTSADGAHTPSNQTLHSHRIACDAMVVDFGCRPQQSHASLSYGSACCMSVNFATCLWNKAHAPKPRHIHTHTHSSDDRVVSERASERHVNSTHAAHTLVVVCVCVLRRLCKRPHTPLATVDNNGKHFARLCRRCRRGSCLEPPAPSSDVHYADDDNNDARVCVL